MDDTTGAEGVELDSYEDAPSEYSTETPEAPGEVQFQQGHLHGS